MVNAPQAVAVTLGMFVAARGDVHETILGTVNYGRYNETYASIGGSIAGALHGIDAVPQ